MKLKVIITFFYAASILQSCGQSGNKVNPSVPTSGAGYDTSKIAIIQYDFRIDWPFDTTYQSSSLSISELNLLDKIINQAVLDYNSKLEKKNIEDFGINFTKYDYKRQYFAVTNKKGEKEVWANFFCKSWDRNWKASVFLVDDGGNCYFNLRINLNTRKAFNILVNGYA